MFNGKARMTNLCFPRSVFPGERPAPRPQGDRDAVGQQRTDLCQQDLLPRLGKFIAQFPDIRVTIDTSQGLVDLTLDDFDIAIRFASTKKPAANWTLLAMETLFPVCSPDLKEKFGVASDTTFCRERR